MTSYNFLPSSGNSVDTEIVTMILLIASKTAFDYADSTLKFLLQKNTYS